MFISEISLRSIYNLLQRRPRLVHGNAAQEIWLQLPVLHSSPVAQRVRSMDDSLPSPTITRTLQLAAGLAGVQCMKNNRLTHVFATFRVCLLRLADTLSLQPVAINIG